MDSMNNTIVMEFILVGFHIVEKLQLCVFLIFFLIYISSVSGNITIITVIWYSPKLHSPMYFFLMNLSFMEIWYTSVTSPRILIDIVSEKKIISIAGCICQCYFFFVLSAIENYLLAVMAYDRFLAICNSLRYSTIMNYKHCHQLAGGTWIAGFCGSLIPIYLLSKLSFCGENKIDNFFCDISPLLRLSCSNTIVFERYFFTITWIVIFTCLFFIIASYIQIVWTIIKISSAFESQKAFSTCGSHLIVVSLYYSTVIAMYVRPQGGNSFHFDKILSIIYAVITPLLNPMIYTMRNKELQCILKSYMSCSR